MKREAHQVFVTALFVQETNCPAGFWPPSWSVLPQGTVKYKNVFQVTIF